MLLLADFELHQQNCVGAKEMSPQSLKYLQSSSLLEKVFFFLLWSRTVSNGVQSIQHKKSRYANPEIPKLVHKDKTEVLKIMRLVIS